MTTADLTALSTEEKRRLLARILEGGEGAPATAPASFAQQRLWFLDQLDPGQSTYNQATTVRALGPLDVPALERALAALRQRHETLRTTFMPVGGEPMQVIAPAGAWTLPFTDVGAL